MNASSSSYNDAWLTYAWTRWLRGYARGGAIVDYACGVGVNGAIVAGLARQSVVGVDRDGGCLAESRRRGLTVVRADLTSPLPVRPGTTDVALLIHAIEHVPDAGPLLASLAATLTPGGALVVVTPDWNRSASWFYDDPTHCRPYTASSLADVLETAGLRVRVLTHHNVGYRLGRSGIWKVFKSLCFTGDGLFAIAESAGRDR
jgi:SAM-dependent methyltransferase